MKKVIPFLFLLLFTGCDNATQTWNGTVGLRPSPLFAFLNHTQVQLNDSGLLHLQLFHDINQIGISLLAGELQAGLLDPAASANLLKVAGNQFTIAGLVEFPYGATLVMRRGLSLRLPELAGKRIARTFTSCRLVKQISNDVPRLGLAIDSVNWVAMPPVEMAPALEAGLVEAAVVSGDLAIQLQSLGHTILYQNWHMTESDDCCPKTNNQTGYYLLHQRKVKIPHAVLSAFVASNKVPTAELRSHMARFSQLPDSILANLPVSSFQIIDSTQAELLTKQLVTIQNNESHDQHEDHEHHKH